MKSIVYGAACAAIVLSPAQSFAQATAAAAPAIMPVVATPSPAPLVPGAETLPPGSNAMLRTGTELSLTLLHELTTEGKHLRIGDRAHLEVAEPLLINGVTVIPQGSPATGEVVELRNKGMWGKSGKFVVRLLNVSVNGRQIRLGGTFDDKGVAGGWGAAAVSALVFLPAGFFMTGTSARLPAGTAVRGFVDEDVPLALPAVPVSTAVLTVTPAPPPAAAIVAADATAPTPTAKAGTPTTETPAGNATGPLVTSEVGG
jgi:hypothetical protein